ncbi:MAG: Signal peptidase [Caulobacteraceae bacterium]|nr:Signal peptidase [Caulobacteraceae bacterium]
MSEADAAADPSDAALEESTSDKPAPGGVVAELVEIGKTILYALGIALALRVLLFQPYTIPSESMEPNLLKNDYIIVSKFSYGWSRHSFPFSPALFKGRLLGREPHRGDIVVFKLPRDGHTDYIKRVVGLPGDKIQVADGLVMINGSQNSQVALPPTGSGYTELTETNPDGKTYTIQDMGPGYAADNTAVYTVPQGCYFMMGDNRDNSLDSRFDPGYNAVTASKGLATCAWDDSTDANIGNDAGVGFVPFEDLEGRAQMILASWKEGVSAFKPWTWFLDARLNRFFKSLR